MMRRLVENFSTGRGIVTTLLASGVLAFGVSAAEITGSEVNNPGNTADLKAGEEKAMLCVSCHGQQGISALPMYPNLAGQKELYLRKQLQDFRSGYRPSLVMAPMAKHLSDEDIINLAGYFASLGTN